MIEIEQAERLCRFCYAKGFVAAAFLGILAAAAWYAIRLRLLCEEGKEKMERIERRLSACEDALRPVKPEAQPCAQKSEFEKAGKGECQT